MECCANSQFCLNALRLNVKEHLKEQVVFKEVKLLMSMVQITSHVKMSCK